MAAILYLFKKERFVLNNKFSFYINENIIQ